MNFFKKALVATAVVASFGAAADATVSSTPLKLSQQGIADGLTADDQLLSFDVVVGTLHPASSTITLTFDSKVDLDDLACAGGSVNNNIGVGQGECGDVGFDYGTGSFTFDNVVIDTTTDTNAHTISFDINLGNPLTANSAFRIVLGAHSLAGGAGVDKVDISGASNVDYSSVDSLDAAIETGTGVIASEESQFSFKVTNGYDKLIDRVNLDEFTDATDNDQLTMEFTDNQGLLAPLTDNDVTITVEGELGGLLTADFNASTSLNGSTALVLNSDELTVDVLGDDGSLALDGTAEAVVVDFNGITATNIPVTGDLEAMIEFQPTGNGTTNVVFATAVDAGQWALDATVINVPYFPVGFEGISTSIHFANEDSNDADIIVSAIGADGDTVYGPTDLGRDLPANEVTKVGQDEIMALFGITASEKLSVTFNIDADEGDVNAYAFSNAGDARQQLANSQQKGK